MKLLVKVLILFACVAVMFLTLVLPSKKIVLFKQSLLSLQKRIESELTK